MRNCGVRIVLLPPLASRTTTMMKNPCKDCPNRYPGCHSKCERYKAWKQEWDKLKEKERIYNEQQRIFRRKF